MMANIFKSRKVINNFLFILIKKYKNEISYYNFIIIIKWYN